MRVVPEGPGLISGGELVVVRATGKDGALVDKCNAIFIVRSFLKEPMPVLKRQNCRWYCVMLHL
jgi:hypothetical protein